MIGQDIASSMTDLARERAAVEEVEGRLSFICGDFESGGFVDEFDGVIFHDCLHHAEDVRAAIASAYRALKPGGVLITHEPGEGHSTAPGSIEAMRLYGVAERDMPPHLIWRHAQEIGFRSFRLFPMLQELLEVFYHQPPLKTLRKGWRHRAKRIWKMAFAPSDRASAIRVLMK